MGESDKCLMASGGNMSRNAKQVIGPLALGFSVALGFIFSVPDAANVKVMSYNLRCPCGDVNQFAWAARKDLVVGEVKKYLPDFLGTQENVPPYQIYLDEKLPEYDYFGRGRKDTVRVPDKNQDEGAHLYYLKAKWEVVKGDSGTFQMSATPEVWGSKTWSFLPRVTTWGLFREKATGRLLYVYNTHWDNQTGRDEFSKMTADTIATRKHKDIPVFFLGDLNQTNAMNSVKYLLGQDVYADKKPVITMKDSEPTHAKIDNILAWPAKAVDSLPMDVVDTKFIQDTYTVGDWTNVSPTDHPRVLVEFKVWKSEVVSVLKKEKANPLSLQVSASEQAVRINYANNDVSQPRQLQIHSVSGQRVASLNLNQESGAVSWSLPQSKRGVYLFTVVEMGKIVFSAKKFLSAPTVN